MITTPTVHGWVMHNVRDATISFNNNGAYERQSLHRYTCPSISSPSTTTSRFASMVEDEVLEYLDDDDDDDDDGNDDDESGAGYDYQGALVKQEKWMKELQRLSRSSSTDDSAVARAQEIFDDMFRTYVESDDATFFPTVHVYNLLLETHAYSTSEDGASEAEGILTKMEDESNDFVARPNEESYWCVMDAWAVRKQPEKVKEVFERIAEPSTEAHNKLIQAYGMAKDFDNAESIFRPLLADGKANHKSWVQLMKARQNSKRDKNDPTVESYFDEMQEEGFEPETEAYNVLLRTIGRNPKTGFQRAEALLFQMMSDFREGNNERVKPNAGTFRTVLEAYRRQGEAKLATPSSATKVEQLLQFKEGLQLTDSEGVLSRDEQRIYKIVLEVLSWSKNSKKAAKADRILRKLEVSNTVVVSIDLYALVLEACASTEGTSEEKYEAFQVALGILKDLRSSPDLGVDGTTTGLFLRACNNLMPAGPKRDETVTKVFRDCCESGLVDGFVLSAFEQATSEDLQLEILGGFSVDGVSIPNSWSRNVGD
jgi:hypothetical protein